MGLAILILGLIVMIGCHVFVMRRDARAATIDRLGETAYRVLFSLVALVGLALVAWGFARYRATGWIDVWFPPVWTAHVTVALMVPAMILIAAAYFRGRIYVAVKHPMLAGVKLWAAGHLISNGDLGSILLFGSVLAWAVADRISLKSRQDPGGPSIPVGGWQNDVWAVVVGSILYLAIGFAFHPVVIGVPVFGR